MTPHEYNAELVYNEETGMEDWNLLTVTCPSCQREFAAFRRRTTAFVSQGLVWRGLDYQEPYHTYITQCRCGTVFYFQVYWPQ